MAKLTKGEALDILQACQIERGAQFYVLRSSQVCDLLEHAKARGYRKRRDAPGSTGRMFYAYVCRAAQTTD